MDSLILYAVLPVFTSVVSTMISNWIVERSKGRSLTRKMRIAIVALVAVLIAGGLLLFLPPYKVSRVEWCRVSEQELSVKGRLNTRLGTPADDEEVQIKIFPAGANSPLGAQEAFGRTSADGNFDIKIRLSLPADNRYLINTAYKYSTLSVERWQVSDFRMGDIRPCPP